MAFDSTIVTATGASDRPDQLQFDGDWLQPTHLGTVLRVRDATAGKYRVAVIHEVISSRACRVGWYGGESVPLGQSTLLWEEQALSGPRGYPRSVCIYQQRLVFGGIRDAGSLLLLSVSGQFRNFDLGEAADDNAIAVIGAGGVRTIKHVAEGAFLTILTENGTSYLPVDALKPLTPTTVRYQRISPHGSGNARPSSFDGGLLMVTDGGMAVRDLAYSTEAENIQAEPVSLQATGFLGSIVDAAYLVGTNDRPEELAFFVNASGKMVVFHSIRSQKIGAWFEWSTAGTWTSVAVCGKVVWAVVVREPGVYILEQFDTDCPFDSASPFGPIAEANVKLPLSLPHAPSGDFFGHAIDSNGDYLGFGPFALDKTFTVTRQTGELGDLGTRSGTVGMAFSWWIDPLPPAVDLADGTMLRRSQRLVRSSLRLLETQSATNGREGLVLRRSSDAVELPPPAASYWWTTTHLGWARPRESEAAVVPRITRALPLPVAVLAMKREIKV